MVIMEKLNKLEGIVADWFKAAPHLPETSRKWIATNIWWIELIGVVVSVFGVLAVIGVLSTAFSFLTAVGVATGYFGYVTSYSWWYFIASIVQLVFMAGGAVIMALAVTPLKEMKKKGWDLLFLMLVVNTVTMLFSAISSSYTIFSGLIGGAIGIAIGAYFLFEIRSYFVKVKSDAKPPVPPVMPAKK